jgi:hypothetical protein
LPSEVVLALLHRRFCGRVKGKLSETNRRLFCRVWPIAQMAFTAKNSDQVYTLAQAILDILRSSGKPLDGLASYVKIQICAGCSGERHDQAHEAFGGDASVLGNELKNRALEDLLPSDQGTHPKDHITPKPYLDLLHQATPHTNRLIRYLQVLPSADQGFLYSDRGGRFSLKAYLRNRERPFRQRVEDETSQKKATIGVLVDCSSSMEQNMPAVRLGVMILHLACKGLGIEHGIWVFSSWPDPYRGVKGFDDPSTFTPAYIAGLQASGGTNLLAAMKSLTPKFAETDTDIKLLLVIHDGQPESVELCQRYIVQQRTPYIVGVYLGEGDAARMRQLFAGRLIATASEHLPEVLSNFLLRLMARDAG